MSNPNPEPAVPSCQWCGQTTPASYALHDWPAIDDCGNCATVTTRGRGRPRTGTAVMVRIPPHVLAVIDAMAETRGTTRANIIREQCVAYTWGAALGRNRKTVLGVLQSLITGTGLTPEP